MRSCLSGPDSALWMTAGGAELTKLVRDTATMRPVMTCPRKPTYYNPVPREKWKGYIERRVRGVGGGDRCYVDYPVATHTCPMSVFKILLHATVSENSHFGSLDLTDFFLGSLMPAPEYLIIMAAQFTPALLDTLGITPFLQTDSKGRSYFFTEVSKTMYGFRQAGFHANEQVIAHLLSHGYYQTQPCLFTHTTDPIVFCLVVDDYGVKYTHVAQFHRLVDCLSLLYHVKASPVATSFLGFTISHDRQARTIALSMPSYIPNMLARFRPEGVPPARSPSIYTPPSYGSSAPQLSPTDTSAPASPAQIEELPQAIGSLLYYARALDCTMLPAVTTLSSLQSAPTLNVIAKLNRLLGYCSAFPDHQLIFRPSRVLLQTHSDASFNSLPRSGSKSGGHHTLGNHDPAFHNAPIDVDSSRIPVVTSSAADAELAAAYGNARSAHFHRATLQNIGYPQPPSPIFCDNECAIGISSSSVKQKKSKSMDMRFNWLRDRVSQHHFYLPYIPSLKNIADFFTKPLPVHRHAEFSPLLVHKP